MSALTVREVDGLAELGLACADEIIRICAARQGQGEVPCIALTGGRAGAAVLSSLGERAAASDVDWARVRFIWGDERWLPAGDAERNDLMADTSLFASATVDPALVHRVASSDAGLSVDEAAAQYAATIAEITHVDVSLCGVGEDGHVASLFPGRDDLLVDAVGTPDAIAVRDSPKPPAERVSLSLPALRRAERVWLLACGAGKAEAIADLRARREPLVPAALVSGRTETVLWADAAALG
ncbi:6-phosphogluconolactonase [Leucobacter exalbidus]|uniref:6-phosphogluconolactonase n=1 Tax=Leucobacter exalbidus TaxID=662960 RepID=A0A940T319_9MICO|nr:6-phosphogluconolactonase [Leucobacter exalbidus]MBP1325229.1 6-phosphogluconolactonase [Leucobacter exalbidus]